MTAFGAWLQETQVAIANHGEATVPCQGCTACCRAGQFVLIEPDEADTLARIPKPLQFPAPQRPRGYVVLPHDDRGHCPMLVDDRCSIYEHRPRACRTYDCRVFAATGLTPDAPDVATRAATWEFSYPTEADRRRHQAVRAAAAYLRRRPELLPTTNPTQIAVLAIECASLFESEVPPDDGAIRAEIARLVTTPGAASTS